MKHRLGAFVMTYNRPVILVETIHALFSQSWPPEFVLIVDNSPGTETEKAVLGLNNKQLGYYRMGYNAGPAGASAVGLKKLQELGFDWILWGDDDDPPPTPQSIERVLGMVDRYGLNPQEVGVMGMVGGRLNRRSGRTLNFSNKQLKGAVDADYIPGGKLVIVNRAVPLQGILPSPELFFSFEDLDFCLKVKRAGFKVLIDGDAMLQSRLSHGFTDPDYRWKGVSTLGDESKLWRAYYSTRNILIIMRRNGNYVAVISVLAKSAVKSIYGFRFGMTYGTRNFVMQWKAILHFLFDVTGRTIDR